jgi:ABC-2 type transport system permease protein
MSASASELDLHRPVPRLGGFSVAVVRIEVRRLLRNRRTLVFTVVTPALFFLLFGLNHAYASRRVGSGNVSAFVMISMALYGSVLATTTGGAMVAVERAAGWSRQLRVTPLAPWAYVAVKMATSLVLGLVAVVSVYVVGALAREPTMPKGLWLATGVEVWIGSLVFAALGLLVGYLLPSENVMQVLGFLIMLCAFGGGLFVPLSQFSPPLRRLATFTPLYGLNELVHYPLVGGRFDWAWVANLLVWLGLFSAGAAWRFRRDTARV